jgi:hypothetical protein
LDELRTEELRFLSDDEVAGRLDELEHASRLIEAERARSLAEMDRRGSWETDGRLSLTAWLADRHLIAHGVAGAHVRLAQALEQMPRTSAALAAGAISPSAAGLLASARETAPDAFARSEELLVEAAGTLPVPSLKRAVEFWRHAADAERATEEEGLRFERRGLHASPTLGSMVRVDGNLDPECGQHVLTALRAAMDADVRSGSDERTLAQRRADALGAICRAFLDRSDRPVVGGERPHVVVLLDVETLERRAPGRSELVDAGSITPEAARRWACDADVSRVITVLVQCRWTSAGAPRWSRRRCGERSWFEIITARSPGATDPSPGARRTM